MNKWTGIGRLTRDSELIYTPSGVAITTFTIAVDRRFKNAQGERETDFITIKTFKKLAELCAEYTNKGKQVGVTGELQIRTYNDSEGKKHWVTEIIADEVQFLSPKDKDEHSPQQQTQSQQQYSSQPPYGAPPQNGQPPYPGPYAPPGYAPQGQPPAQGYQQAPPGYMPPPASYQGTPPTQGPPGSVPSSRIGREVNLDDDIPF